MTKKQIANSKRRTRKRAKKSLRRTPKQIQKLPGPGMTDAEKRAIGRKLDVEFARQEKTIIEAFKQVPQNELDVELPGYTVPEGESEGIIIYGDERDDKFLKANKNNPYRRQKKGKTRKRRRKVNPR